LQATDLSRSAINFPVCQFVPPPGGGEHFFFGLSGFLLAPRQAQELVKRRELLGIDALQLRGRPEAPGLELSIPLEAGNHGLRFPVHFTGRQAPETVRITARLDPLGVDGGPIPSGERI
jgi:hypothetical protein